ncbi:unnamed protein product [Brassicogethes aeneus]|uniref:Uncharacterized protein n=1 Tax=Brassicogethes aeneus TaxID=1431903 RepID=A0A9P0FEJ4_BRAAE|nr:unnamed protein product [Brassicogethes aeneus]
MSARIVSKRQLRRKIKANVSKIMSEIKLSANQLDKNTFKKIRSNQTSNLLLSEQLVESKINSRSNLTSSKLDERAIVSPKKIIMPGLDETYAENILLSHTLSTSITQSKNITKQNSSYEVDTTNNVALSENTYALGTTNNVGSSKNTDVFLQNFQQWALKNNITHTAINDLIKLIKEKYPFLPNDARTILGTPKNNVRIKLDNGEMIYFGIENELRYILKSIQPEKRIKTFVLQFNVDGISPYNNSSLELWPILCKINNYEGIKPFVVAVFSGRGKPLPINKYLENFVNEAKNLLKNGLDFEYQKIRIQILLFTCDAPARAYLKQVKGHTSKNGCERCTITSQYENKKHFYPTGDHELLEDATVMLQNIIEASESESGAGVPPLTRKNNFYELENESETRNRSEMRDRSKSPDRSDTPLGALPSSYSSTRGRSISRVRSESRDRSQTRDRSQNRDTSETHDRSDTPLGALSSPSYSATLTSASSLSTSVALNEGVTERILQTMLSISEQVAQNTLRNQQILRILNSNECAVLKKPDNFPILPCTSKEISGSIGEETMKQYMVDFPCDDDEVIDLTTPSLICNSPMPPATPQTGVKLTKAQQQQQQQPPPSWVLENFQPPTSSGRYIGVKRLALNTSQLA